jgi:hypothetical protein
MALSQAEKMRVVHRAICFLKTNNETFVYDFFIYSEVPITIEKLFDALDDIEIVGNVSDDLLNYCLDVLSGKAKPNKVKK